MKTASLRGLVFGAFALLGVSALPSNAWAYTLDFSQQNLGKNSTSDVVLLGSPVVFQNVGGSGVKVTLSASQGVLTYDKTDGTVGIKSCSEGSGTADEVGGAGWAQNEKLTIDFSKAVALSSVTLEDLYVEGNPSYSEQGSYTVYTASGSSYQTFAAVSPTDTDGTKILQFSGDLVTKIVFDVPVGSTGSDYSIAKLVWNATSSSVPELDSRSAFGAIGLLFVGLMVGTSRRRGLHSRLGA